MKSSIILCVVMLVVASTSCATQKGNAWACPPVELIYSGSALGEHGWKRAIFSIKNLGRHPIELPLDSGNIIHGQYATTEERSSEGDDWRPFNLHLSEYLAPTDHLTIGPGEQQRFKYGADGLLLPGQQDAGMEYSIVVTDAAGCVYRSVPFVP